MKDHKVMFKAILLGTAGMWLAATLIEWSAVNAITFIPGVQNIDQVVPLILQRGLNPFLASVFIAGIVAAGMSTIDGVLVITSGAFSRDIYQKMINKKATDEQVMKLSRWVTLGIGATVVAFGIFKPGTIFEINLFAFSGMGIFVIPVLFGMYWRKSTLTGAISSVVVGIVLLILLTSIPSLKSIALGFHPLLPSAVVAAIVMVIVSLYTKTPSQETIARHFDTFKKQEE